jgi:putative flavoprotein involved in K+ transport
MRPQMSESTDVVVIGAGQAGVCLSHFLQREQIPHVVLERDQPFWNFKNTWDAFLMNTPNWVNELPDSKRRFAPSQGRNAIAARADVLEYLEAYLEQVKPPLQTGEDITRVAPDNGHWAVESASGKSWNAKAVAVCTGISRRPSKPEKLAAQLPEFVTQVHSIDYRRPDQLDAKRVVVVGSGASGTQIARDLAESKRFDEVVLACSEVGILPTKILGIIPTMKLLYLLGVMNKTRDSKMGQRIMTKTAGKGQATIPPGPKDLAKKWGVRCVGRLAGADADQLRFDDGAKVSAEGTAVVWCTGFSYDFGFLDLEGLDPYAEPSQVRGVSTDHPGLYFLGLKFLYRVKSHLLGGVGEDAEYVAEQIKTQVA